MVKVKFRYKDKLSHGNWNEQECRVKDLEECKKIYGLGIDEDCEYEIISVEEIKFKENKSNVEEKI